MGIAQWIQFSLFGFAASESTVIGLLAAATPLEGFGIANVSPGGATQAIAGILLNQMDGDIVPGAGFDAVGTRPKLWGPKRAWIPFVSKFTDPFEEPPQLLAAVAGDEGPEPEPARVALLERAARAAAFKKRHPKVPIARARADWRARPVKAALVFARMRERNLALRERRPFATSFEALREPPRKKAKPPKEPPKERTE